MSRYPYAMINPNNRMQVLYEYDGADEHCGVLTVDTENRADIVRRGIMDGSIVVTKDRTVYGASQALWDYENDVKTVDVVIQLPREE